MTRMPFVVAAVLVGVITGNARADLLPLFGDVPSTYIPGTSFTFQIVMPDMLSDGSPLNGLSQFQVGLVFDAAVNNPALGVSASAPSSGYVFPATSGFTSDSFSGPGPNEVSLQFMDSISPNFVTVGPGQDILATVTVSPDASLTGPITVSFTSYTNVTFFSEGFDQTPPSVTIDQGIPPVPTPAGWLTLSIGSLILIGRNRLLKRS